MPDLERIFAAARVRQGKRPVIVIPGVLGSQLVNAKTGEVVWPSLFRSTVDDLRLPVSPELETNTDDLKASRVLDVARFARYAPEVYIYYELLQALKRFGGYREGNWENPAPDGDRDTFYVFAYDWRKDNVSTARSLIKQIDELKRKLNKPDLRFNVVAHSMGGLVARYAAMYGDADLPSDSSAIHPTWAGAREINKVFMFATPNEGTMEAFATLLEGYSATDGLRPRVRIFNNLLRDDVFTAPAMFQLLPHGASATFLDSNLQPLSVNLYDPEVWRRYGWSSAASEETKLYFAAVLRRAQLFHQALDARTSDLNSPISLYAFGGDCEDTLAAPIILPDPKQPDRWLTLLRPRSLPMPDGRRVSRREVTRLMFAPGDGRVTRRSLLNENARDSANDSTLSISYTFFACDLHGDVPNNKIIQDNALTLLVSEVMQ